MSDEWINVANITSKQFDCWCCCRSVASKVGYHTRRKIGSIYICPHCETPNYYDRSNIQMPAPAYGNGVTHLPNAVKEAYQEARSAYSTNAFTASAMMCRKILMSISVEQGAEENKAFSYYVSWLFDQHYIPPNSKDWVDHIRLKGNEANHEIPSISQDDAKELVLFCEALLKNIYELPGKFVKITDQDDTEVA